jgi:hypothetical protein
MERGPFVSEKAALQERTDADRIRSLLDQLEARDAQIEELEEEKEELRNAFSILEERRDNGDEWSWRHIRRLEASEKEWDLEDKLLTPKNYDLPVPRLEIRWRDSDDGYNQLVDYGLVMRHLLGHILFVPISSTRIGGGGVPDAWSDEQKELHLLRTPFRDGCHMAHDAAALGLPCYVVSETTNTWRKVEVTEDGKLANPV